MMYTAICGDIDEPRTDVSCFTVRGPFDNRMGAKHYKILSHLFFQETTVWMDGNIRVTIPEEEMIANFLGDSDIALFKHPYRTSVYDECRVCQKWKKETKEKIQAFQDFYGEEKLKALPLYECGVLIRRHNPEVVRFNKIWWELITRWSARDQLTCALAIKESGVKVNVIHGNLRRSPIFSYSEHNKPGNKCTDSTTKAADAAASAPPKPHPELKHHPTPTN